MRMSRFGNFPSKPFATRTGENENLFRLVDSAIVEILGRLLFAFGFIPGGGMLSLLGLFNVSIKRGWFLFTRPLVEGVTVPLLFFEEFLKEEFFFNFLIKDLASNSSKLLSSTVRSTVGGAGNDFDGYFLLVAHQLTSKKHCYDSKLTLIPVFFS